MLWAMSSPVSCFHHLFHPVALLIFAHIDLEIDNNGCRQCLSRYLHATYSVPILYNYITSMNAPPIQKPIVVWIDLNSFQEI